MLGEAVLLALAFPLEAKGFAASALTGQSVPVEGAGGYFDGVGEVGEVMVNPTFLGNEIIRSAIIQGANGAFVTYGQKMLDDLEDQTIIENLLYYQDSLVEDKYTTDQIKKYHGFDYDGDGVDDVFNEKDSAGKDRDIAESTVSLADDFESSNFLTDAATAEAVFKITQKERDKSAADRQKVNKEFRKILAGAITQFLPSISCAIGNKNALQKTTELLALETVGFIGRDIDPNSPEFYEQMAKLGNPFATPPFWNIALQDAAQATESKARQAATLEILSPGIKAPQGGGTNARDAKKISRSISLIQEGKKNTWESIYQSVYKGSDSSANSFLAYGAYIAALYSASHVNDALNNLSGRGGLLGKIGKIAKKVKDYAKGSELWKGRAKVQGNLIAKGIANTFIRGLYKQMNKHIFKGRILAESKLCRKQVATKNFTSSIDPNRPIDVLDGRTPTGVGSIRFNVAPQYLDKAYLDVSQVILEWDTSFVEIGIGLQPNEALEVSLSGGRFGTGQTVSANGGDVDNPDSDTTYTLTVTKIDTTTSSPLSTIFTDSKTVTVLDYSRVLFDVQPRQVAAGANQSVIATWDTTAVTNDPGIQVFGNWTDGSELPRSGQATIPIDGIDGDVVTLSLFVKGKDHSHSVTRDVDVSITTGMIDNSVSGSAEEEFVSVPFRMRE